MAGGTEVSHKVFPTSLVLILHSQSLKVKMASSSLKTLEYSCLWVKPPSLPPTPAEGGEAPWEGMAVGEEVASDGAGAGVRLFTPAPLPAFLLGPEAHMHI